MYPKPRLRWKYFTQAGSDWLDHNDSSQGAAIAYYTTLSLAPLLVVIVGVAGLFFGPDAVRGQVFWHIRHVIGDQAAGTIQTLLRSAYHPAAGIIASAGGFVVLLVGASGVFLQLRQTLNQIWGVDPNVDSGWRGLVRSRVFSFAIILGTGLLLMVSLAASAVLQAVGAYVSQYVAIPAGSLELINFVITLLIMSFLFALVYKIIPETRVEWEDVAIGAIFTALLFAGGKFVIGLYLGRASVGSAYGAAGSLVVLLVWVYYSSQIFLYGAEFTHVYSVERKKATREARPSVTRTQGALQARRT